MSVFVNKRRRSQPQIAKSGGIPAPIGGINANDPLANMNPEDLIYSFNMIPMQNGLHVRDGYQEWETAVAGAGGIRTMISLKSQNATGGSQDKMFAVTILGIYDVTGTGTAPALVVVFPAQTGDAGYGTYTRFTTVADQFLLYFDEVNGMYTYAVSTGVWLKVSFGAGANQILGVDPATLAMGVSHAGRLFFVERNSSRSWYLAPGAIYGTATLFELGNKFQKGGYLVGAYVNSVSGQSGPVAYIVFISSAGDVSVWTGSDPSTAATWSTAGCFYIGDTPLGRNIATFFNGDLFMISIFGVTPLQALIAGLTLNDQIISYTSKISTLINQNIFATRLSRGWEIVTHPRQNMLIINSPVVAGQPPLQYVQNLATKGWGLYRGIPYQCSTVFGGQFYFGTADNRVCLHIGDADNVALNGTGALAINWSMLTAFAKSDPVMKIPSFIRAYFTTAVAPSFDVKIYFDYNTVENISTIPYISPGGSVWDAGLWDTAIWGGGISSFNSIEGGVGIGVNMAIALRGSSISQTTLIGFEAVWREGSFM